MRRLEDADINITETDAALHSGTIGISKLAEVIDLAVYRATDSTGQDIPADEESHGADIIARFGLMEAVTLAAHILNVTVLGSIKKLELDEKNGHRDLFSQLQPQSRSWRNFTKVGLLWAAIISTSGIVAFLTSRFYTMLT
jgi:hypothetical protein